MHRWRERVGASERDGQTDRQTDR
eukprot:COSAG03_NODE_19736_length_331_cov_0.646552_1_plen_23_part_10